MGRTVALRPAEFPEVVRARLSSAPVLLDGFSPVALVGVAQGRHALNDELGWASAVDLWLCDATGSRWVRVGAADFELVTLLDNGAAVVSTLDGSPWTWTIGGWYAEAVRADELVAAHDARIGPIATWERSHAWTGGDDRVAAAVTVDVWRRCVLLRRAGSERVALMDQLAERLPPDVRRRYELNQVVCAVTMALVRLAPGALAALDERTSPDELVAFLTSSGAQFLPVLSTAAAEDVVDAIAAELSVDLGPDPRARLVARLAEGTMNVVELSDAPR